jgi:hypothetical protein
MDYRACIRPEFRIATRHLLKELEDRGVEFDFDSSTSVDCYVECEGGASNSELDLLHRLDFADQIADVLVEWVHDKGVLVEDGDYEDS